MFLYWHLIRLALHQFQKSSFLGSIHLQIIVGLLEIYLLLLVSAVRKDFGGASFGKRYEKISGTAHRQI